MRDEVKLILKETNLGNVRLMSAILLRKNFYNGLNGWYSIIGERKCDVWNFFIFFIYLEK